MLIATFFFCSCFLHLSFQHATEINSVEVEYWARRTHNNFGICLKSCWRVIDGCQCSTDLCSSCKVSAFVMALFAFNCRKCSAITSFLVTTKLSWHLDVLHEAFSVFRTWENKTGICEEKHSSLYAFLFLLHLVIGVIWCGSVCTYPESIWYHLNCFHGCWSN